MSNSKWSAEGLIDDFSIAQFCFIRTDPDDSSKSNKLGNYADFLTDLHDTQGFAHLSEVLVPANVTVPSTASKIMSRGTLGEAFAHNIFLDMNVINTNTTPGATGYLCDTGTTTGNTICSPNVVYFKGTDTTPCILYLSDGGAPNCAVGSAGLLVNDSAANVVLWENTTAAYTVYPGTRVWSRLVDNGSTNGLWEYDWILHDNDGRPTWSHVDAPAATTIAAGAGAGTSPTIALSGSDVCGTISLTTGSSPTGSGATVATITSSGTWPAAPKLVLLFPDNAATKALAIANQCEAFTANATKTTWTITSGPTGLTGATAYKWKYLVIG